ncbi:NAD(P)H-dependent oxidoreductase [Streptomyces virginiae]|uniref:NAD(P)H-dependent oxidoreductase n=2 Tax=Streptomyces TaxID=1883 RepID=A0ABZ1TRX1_STRVG|nr:NAD(P)H-dependent oxidoreductase [Streptomyces virginiae]
MALLPGHRDVRLRPRPLPGLTPTAPAPLPAHPARVPPPSRPAVRRAGRGLFKSFFDLIDKDALTGTPVLIGATGGTARHSLVTEHAMRPLFTHLRAPVVPTAVYAASEDWGAQGLAQRITRAGTELARSMGSMRPTARDGAPDVDTAAAIASRSPTGAITSTDPTNGLRTVPFAQRPAALQAG